MIFLSGVRKAVQYSQWRKTELCRRLTDHGGKRLHNNRRSRPVYFEVEAASVLFWLAEGVFSLYQCEFQRMPFQHKDGKAAFFC